jgi:hypothetical protein
MPDKEKVIKGLECLISNDVPCEGCPYYGSGYCLRNIAKDAMDLLKEQEAVEPKFVGVNTWTCGECGAVLGWEDFTQSGLELVEYKFCPGCGKAVKWDG